MDFEKLLKFIEQNDPHRWLLTFCGSGEMRLEFFRYPEDADPHLEADSGDDIYEGSIEDICRAIKAERTTDART